MYGTLRRMAGAGRDNRRVDKGWRRRLVRAVDAAVRDSGAAFDVAIKYRMLMYTFKGDWRHWVCAISQTKKAAA